jgi:ribonuclease D
MADGVKQKMNHTDSLTYQFIDNRSDLEAISHVLSRTPCVAVDLEADSLYHYKEKICLIQIATNQMNIVLDALRIDDLSSLKPVFSNSDIQKIFHGADYDVRSLYRDFQISITNLFDTQLSCRFLGVQETGLEAVLLDRFNVQLDKKYQKKNWSKRPLPKEMIEYAALDVHYLIPLAEQLQRELEEKGRKIWLEEECGYLSRVRSPTDHSEPLFLRIKGSGRLDPRSLEILEALLQMREQIAARRDKPVFQILRNQTLLRIATMKTADLEYLKRRGVLTSKQVDVYGDVLSEAIHKALALPVCLLRKYPHSPPPIQTPEVRHRIRALRAWRNKTANALKLESGLICSKALMAALSEKKPKDDVQLGRIKEMRTWQRKAFGRDILKILNQ